MFLKSTPIRNGIAFLQPANVDLKGYQTEDHDVNREQIFLSSLRKRLGYVDPCITCCINTCHRWADHLTDVQILHPRNPSWLSHWPIHPHNLH